ncbi:MAG TPA: threonine--tRNA ligase [Acidimicrobiales bacterium]|nr:threonine--tRNA ligase [Acidimicrobiales bacterium]
MSTTHEPSAGGMISVVLPDGSSRQLPAGSTGTGLAAAIGRRLAEDAVAVTVDGAQADMDWPLPDGATVKVVTAASPEGRAILRHSTAHVMAQAVTRLWPGARYAIGPPIEDGFYYDFELPGGAHFSDDDLARIEDEMRKIIAEDQRFVREEHTLSEGLEIFADQPYKREIIEGVGSPASKGLKGEGSAEATSEGAGAAGVSTYRNVRPSGTGAANIPGAPVIASTGAAAPNLPGSPVSAGGEPADFIDLCRGPHVPSTSRLGYFKLTKLAAAYWRGDERRPQLQRIYGTAWESRAALDEHLERVAEAERRDHRRLGAELDLFHFPPEIGSGLAVFHPKGGLIRKVMEDYSREEHLRGGYEFVYTPHITKANLFELSGHLEWYAEGMYPPMEMEGASYYPKPMNCPMHILIYKGRQRSYRELPLRLFEFGTVYRFERSGVLNGLLRARGFTQDDSHIFCAREQLEGELSSLLAFVLRLLRRFGLTDFEAELSTRPEKYLGTIEEWDRATEALHLALKDAEIPYRVAEGEGAFYAPKVDVHVRDAIGRRWQVSTIQVDFQEPQRFDMEYVGADNSRHQPYMVHRALFGSIERFFAILLEHYAGALPTWLSPVQAQVLPVRDDHEPYARGVVKALREAGFRADLGAAEEPLGARVRRAKLEKIPYVLVTGDDDVAGGTVGVNARGSERPERGVSVGALIERLRSDVIEADGAEGGLAGPGAT